MEKLTYSVKIRGDKGQMYETQQGNPIHDFAFETKIETEDCVFLTCKHTFNKYLAVCRQGSKIDISVRCFDSVSRTYPLLYSFYGAENRFIKH